MDIKYSIIILYTLGLVLLGWFSLQSLIYSVMNPSFPSIQFILTIFLMISLSWVIGLSVKKYINKSANGNKRLELKLKMNFVSCSVIAFVCILGLFMF